MHGALGIVQRIDAARLATDIVLVRTRAPGATHHLLMVGGRRGARTAFVDGDALATVRAALHGERHPQQLVWRTRLEGARATAIMSAGIALERDGEIFLFACDAGKFAVRAIGADDAVDAGREGAPSDGAALAAEIAASALGARRSAVAKAIARALGKIGRRVDAVRRDLGRIAEAQDVAVRAQAFVAEAARVPRGAKSMSVVDWSTGEAKTIEMAIDPARSAREHIDAVFKRARRLKEGARVGGARLADTEIAAAKLRAIAEELAGASDLAAIDAIALRAREAAPRDFRASAPQEGARATTKGAQPALPSYRTFRGARGARILVGRGAAHNDELTLHVAKPHDLWLHAKGLPGAHVVVPLAKGASCPPDLLADAAHLAAHFSDARDEAVAEVTHTPRRYVRKPRGSAPGLVAVDREKVIVLRREDARLRALLESEES